MIFVLWDSLSDTLDASDTTVYVVAVRRGGELLRVDRAHELGHALAARREGIEVEGIDLFLFGGVMKMSRDTDSPGAEFRVAVAGPLVTLLLIVLVSVAAVLLAGGDSFWDAARLSGGGRRHAGRGRRLAARLDEPRAAGVQPRARVPARRRPDRPRRGLEADRRPPPGDALRRADRHRLRLVADRSAGSRWSCSSTARRSTGSGSPRSAGCSPPPRAARWRRPRFTEQLAGITVADVMDSEPVTIPAGSTADARLRGLLPALPGLGVVRGRRGRRPLRRPRPPPRRSSTPRSQEGGAMPVRELAAPARPTGRSRPTRRSRRCSRPSRCAASAR